MRRSRHAAAQVPEKGQGKRILVVDDNQDAANSLAVILELEGHRIDIVYTAKMRWSMR